MATADLKVWKERLIECGGVTSDDIVLKGAFEPPNRIKFAVGWPWRYKYLVEPYQCLAFIAATSRNNPAVVATPPPGRSLPSSPTEHVRYGPQA